MERIAYQLADSSNSVFTDCKLVNSYHLGPLLSSYYKDEHTFETAYPRFKTYGFDSKVIHEYVSTKLTNELIREDTVADIIQHHLDRSSYKEVYRTFDKMSINHRHFFVEFKRGIGMTQLSRDDAYAYVDGDMLSYRMTYFSNSDTTFGTPYNCDTLELLSSIEEQIQSSLGQISILQSKNQIDLSFEYGQ